MRLFRRANAAGEAIFPANATIAEMEKNKGDVASLQKQIDDYKAAADTRNQAEAIAQARQAMLGRNAILVGSTIENGQRRYFALTVMGVVRLAWFRSAS